MSVKDPFWLVIHGALSEGGASHVPDSRDSSGGSAEPLGFCGVPKGRPVLCRGRPFLASLVSLLLVQCMALLSWEICFPTGLCRGRSLRART